MLRPQLINSISFADLSQGRIGRAAAATAGAAVLGSLAILAAILRASELVIRSRSPCAAIVERRATPIRIRLRVVVWKGAHSGRLTPDLSRLDVCFALLGRRSFP